MGTEVHKIYGPVFRTSEDVTSASWLSICS